MREQRKISGIKKEERECIKKLFPYIPFRYSTIIHLRWYYSNMAKKIWIFTSSHFWMLSSFGPECQIFLAFGILQAQLHYFFIYHMDFNYIIFFRIQYVVIYELMVDITNEPIVQGDNYNWCPTSSTGKVSDG